MTFIIKLNHAELLSYCEEIIIIIIIIIHSSRVNTGHRDREPAAAYG
jgi:hypothetical protein